MNARPLMFLCLAACASAPQATSLAPMPTKIIRLVGERPGKPPLRRLLIDLTLHNPTESVLAFSVATKVPAGSGGIWVFEQHCQAVACFGRYLGTGGFQGFWLAPGATLRIRNLEVNWWSEAEVSVRAIEIRAAERLLLGDDDARDWFTRDPVVSGEVELDLDVHVANTARRTPDDAEIPVTLLNELPVDLDSDPG